MGYYTDYALTVYKGTANLETVKQCLDEIMEMTGSESLFTISYDGVIQSADSLKWYDHDEEVAELSKRFPGVVFKLSGEGEEAGDLWEAYYMDGKCQICRGQIVYPPFDVNKLVSVQVAQSQDTGRP